MAWWLAGLHNARPNMARTENTENVRFPYFQCVSYLVLDYITTKSDFLNLSNNRVLTHNLYIFGKLR